MSTGRRQGDPEEESPDEATDPHALEAADEATGADLQVGFGDADPEVGTEAALPPPPPPPPVVAPSISSMSSSRSSMGVSAPKGDAWIGRLIANRYQIERELAAGGMGRIYVATQQPLGRQVAIKVVRTEVHGSRQQFLRRFFLEAASCAKLTHPNIVTIHDYGETDEGEVFMVMEYLDGRSLDKEIKDSAPMPPERALHIAIQVSRALREAHMKGIIHRDLKPQNVMLVEQGDEPDFVKVLDFGLVKMLTDEPQAEEITRAGVLLGSPNYMSPEQILGGALDGRTDIYSLGVVLFKMLVGKNPFARDAETDVIYKHVHHPPPTFASVGIEIHPSVEAVVHRCLAKKPEERFADCKDLVIALKEARRESLGLAKKKKAPKKAAAVETPLEALAASTSVVEAAAPPPAPEPVPEPPPPPSRASVSARPSVSPPPPRQSVAPPAPPPRTSLAPKPSLVLPGRVYLREGGAPIGPVSLQQLEVLYASRVLDDDTPVSADGADFAAIAAWARLKEHLGEVRQKLVDGGQPWASEGSSAAFAQDARSVLALLFRAATHAVSGVLHLSRPDGAIRLAYLEGKIVAVEADADELALGAYLVEQGALTVSALAAHGGGASSPSELGGRLIAAGAVAPHVFMEKLGAWARSVLAAALELPVSELRFDSTPPAAPAVPLGLDRFGALVEAVRALPERSAVLRGLDELGPRAAIPSAPQGATIDDLKLAPRELRLLRGIDGSKTAAELMSAHKADAGLARRTLYLALELGLLILGDDASAPKERADAERLRQLLAKLRDKSPFEVLNVELGAPDDVIRSRYMELVKQYHPDHLRPGAAQELKDATQAIFTYVQEVFASIETADKREKYKLMRELGYSGKENEADVVRRVLEAEVAFKKAKTLVKLRKYDEGVAMIRDAIAKKPKDLELKVHLRYYELLADRGDRAAAVSAAIDDIQKLLKTTEVEYASAFMILGNLYKQAANDEQASKFYKRVLKLDEKNHEAESELRLITMRAERQKKKGGLNLGGIVRGLGGSKDKG